MHRPPTTDDRPQEHASPPPQGIIDLIAGAPNPRGAQDAVVYLLRGDVTAGPITEIRAGEGVELPPGRLPLPHPVRLKLLHFNDLHGRIGVFPRLAAWLAATRARHAGDRQVAVLAATAGDESGGTLYDALLGHDPASYQVHPGYRLYSQAGVDIGVPGNHDLDQGTPLLTHAICREARFPILAANVIGSPALANCAYPAALFVVKGLRVGFIGLTTPAQVRPEPYSRRHITDPVTAARHLIPALRPLCDVLIILSHLGLSLGQHSAVVQGAGDVELARSLPPGTVHLIVGGHTHTTLNEAGLSAENIVNGIPIVQAGKFGQFVGEVEITVQETATVTHARLYATIDLPADAAFEREQVQPLEAQIGPHRGRILGRVAPDDDLSADAMRNRFAAGESAFANFLTDALVDQCRAHGLAVDFAMIDATSINSGLRPGETVTFGEWFGVMPFSDIVCVLRLSGQQIEALLRDNALRVDRPGQPHTERGFLHFSAGVRYTVRLGSARGSADAEAIHLDGQPIATCQERTFVFATTSFLRGPAAGWEAQASAQRQRPLFDLRRVRQEYTDLYVRDLLLAHIAAHGGVLPQGGAVRDGRLQVLKTHH